MSRGVQHCGACTALQRFWLAAGWSAGPALRGRCLAHCSRSCLALAPTTDQGQPAWIQAFTSSAFRPASAALLRIHRRRGSIHVERIQASPGGAVAHSRKSSAFDTKEQTNASKSALWQDMETLFFHEWLNLHAAAALGGESLVSYCFLHVWLDQCVGSHKSTLNLTILTFFPRKLILLRHDSSKRLSRLVNSEHRAHGSNAPLLHGVKCNYSSFRGHFASSRLNRARG